MKNLKALSLLKGLLPPLILGWAIRSRINPWNWWLKEYSTWELALSDSSGYNDHKILEKVTTALIQVKSGKAAYERDSVLFPAIEYSWPLLACLMYVAAKNGGRINLVDFGGSLGSSFFQNQSFLKGFTDLKWHVVEQYHFVQRGREQFQDKNLRFNQTIAEALLENSAINVILLGSVLQYLADPRIVFEEIFRFKIKHVIVDRTSFVASTVDVITVQKVPEWIYSASYPCRFFAIEPFVDLFVANGYRLIESFAANDGILDENHFWRGMIFERI